MLRYIMFTIIFYWFFNTYSLYSMHICYAYSIRYMFLFYYFILYFAYIIIMTLQPKHKKRLHTNIIQLIIWIVLLIIAFRYLNNHQAEKINLISWFDGIQKKIIVLREKYTSWKDAFIETQFKLKQQMQELQKSFAQANCSQQIDTTTLQKELNNISEDNVTEFESKQEHYLLIISQYYSLLTKHCK